LPIRKYIEGDRRYPLYDWLMVSYPGVHRKKKFNQLLSSTKMCGEKAFYNSKVVKSF
jgi:hypothetical protein